MRRPYTGGRRLKFAHGAGDVSDMTRVVLAALLLAIPVLTSWILVQRVGHPVKTRR
jgi:hypothetical protein